MRPIVSVELLTYSSQPARACEAGPAAAHAMHQDHMQIVIFNHPLLPMSKSTFYFSVVVLVLVEIVQTGYQRKLAQDAPAGPSKRKKVR